MFIEKREQYHVFLLSPPKIKECDFMDKYLGGKETAAEFSILPMTCTVILGDSFNFL